MKPSTLLKHLTEYAQKHKGDDHAANMLMSFLRGECEHMPDTTDTCELCGYLGGEPKRKVCSECNGGGTSYIDHTKDVSHNYYSDHMNAHTCTKCSGTGRMEYRVWKKKKVKQ